ncbi:Dally-like [Strongyloides ratti]|uniref:Dally-like n=1 Tax=Strongyloides ratti TaxID=34506 RepID=A0A090MU46_STRRB|nr:Dally-like [Strongyloides ratti]CEF61983.1 Dally-like [Strongyloides ratti]
MKTTSFDLYSVPSLPEEVKNLTICTGKRKSCCTTFIEDQMKVVVKQRIENKLQDQIFMLRDFFERHLLSFKQQLREQIFNNKEQLNQMFIKTYGPFYKSNIKVFDELYTELDNYLYANTVKPIPVIVDNFFEQSYLIIFELLNPLRKITNNEQKECLLIMKNELKPFLSFPKRITGQLSKSFTVWRSFFEVIENIVTQLHSLLHTSIPEECINKLVEMEYCQICTFNQINLPGSKPCFSYCSNVLKGCLAEYAEIDTQWNILIDSLLQLFTKLKDVSNPVTTLAPLPAQISESFMVYQERGAELSNRIILNCFDNYEFYNIGRNKRGMSNLNDFNGIELKLRNNKNLKKRRDNDVVTRMIETFSDQLKRMKNFWRTLSESLCDDKISSKDDQFCWNGHEITPRYRYKVIPHGIKKQKYNPEFLSQRLYLTLSKDTYLDQRIKFITLSNTLNRIYYNAKSDENIIEGSGNKKEKILNSIDDDDEDDDNDPYEGSAMEIENEILNDIRYLTMDHVKSAEQILQNQNSSSKILVFYHLFGLYILSFFLFH